jgi:hypothetical protein
MLFLLCILPIVTLIASWFFGRGMSWGWYLLTLLLWWGVCGTGEMYAINSNNILLGALLILLLALGPIAATLVGLGKGRSLTPAPVTVSYQAYTQLSPEGKKKLHRGARIFTKLGLGYLGTVLEAKGRPVEAATLRRASHML